MDVRFFLFKGFRITPFTPVYAGWDGILGGHHVRCLLPQYRNIQFPEAVNWYVSQLTGLGNVAVVLCVCSFCGRSLQSQC